MTKRLTRLIAALALVLALGACGNNDENTDTGAQGSRNADLAGGKQAEEAALALAKCMRENGVDMPDPTSDGFVVIGPNDKNAPTKEQMDKAEAACKKEREAMQGAIPKPPADIEDKMVEMSRCMRSKGIDMPDPTSSGDGRFSVELDPDKVNDPKFKDAQEACRKKVGLPEPGVGMGR